MNADKQAQGGGEVACSKCHDSKQEFNWNGDGPYPCRHCYTAPPSAPVGVEELRALIYLWRQPEPDNGEDETEFDLGCAQTYNECADALEAALAQQPAAVDGAGVDWRAMYRLQTAMRYMDNNPQLTKERAYTMADDDCAGLAAQGAHNE